MLTPRRRADKHPRPGNPGRVQLLGCGGFSSGQAKLLLPECVEGAILAGGAKA